MNFRVYSKPMQLKPMFIALLLVSPMVHAGLEGGVIVGGQGVIVNPNLVIQDSARLAINAAGFGLQLGETFTLQQNLATDIALIRVVGQDPTNIFGSINAKGQLFISNPNGVLFGSAVQVNVGGLVATSLGLNVSDFMAGKFSFSNDSHAGSVVNQGNLTATEGGYIALLAPDVRNEGIVSATMGSVLLAAGDKVTLNLNNGALFGYTIDKGAVNALAENKQLIQADGGQVFMGAKAADAVTMAAVSNSGIIRARTIKNLGGVIRLSGDAVITNAGTLDASAVSGSGGEITLDGRFIALGGTVNASGQLNGGQVNVLASVDISLADHVLATGANGDGGDVRYEAGGQIVESSSSYTDVSGADGGSININAAGGVVSSGTYRALGTAGVGGRVDLSGYSVRLLSANIDASGISQGGLVRIGGAFQGGKLNPETQGFDQFVTRWQDSAEIQNAQRVFVNDSTKINVSSVQGDGGTAIFWSDQETTQLGRVDASGKTRGGAVEISSADTLRRVGLTGVVGAETLLLDPKNIIIGDYSSLSSWTYTALLGSGYVGANSLNIAGLNMYDNFGTAVALNAAGNMLAVGAFGDDGLGNANANSGAVSLFSFTGDNFTGGSLQATIGKGYVGGKNIDVGNLESNDYFGSSVAFNAAGDLLAVGAIGDDGAGNITTDAGAAYMFSFSGSNFTGGSLQAIIGKGYTGGKNVDVVGLDVSDGFGSAVALNATGDRAAIGAYGDDGAGNAASNSGAVHLYSFTDNNFTGGTLQATAGKGYAGGNNINVANLESQDRFGISAAFNAVGDRLAVGAFNDDGAGNLALNSGAVYLFDFANNNFTGGSLQAIAGKGYVGGNNFDVTNLDNSDGFGRAVALNAAGNRLAIGAFNDNGADNLASSSGAVYLLDFADGNFNGGTLKSIIGKGYTGVGDLDLSNLEMGDYFGTSVALNATGDRLAVGAILDDGANNAALDHGAVHLFSLVPDPLASTINFGDYPGQTITLLNTQLESVLNAGTNVVLQASNDITVASAVSVNNASGDGGDLTMQAGRNINFDASVATDNGNLTAVAGDSGAVAGERDAGTATISIGDGVVVDVGTGTATLAAVGGNFVNNSGSSTPVIANRWSIYSNAPTLNTLGGMTATGKHYNQPYVAGLTPAYATGGNWLFYSVAPVLSVTPDKQVVSYGNAPNPFTGSYSGFIDGDNAATSGISGVATFAGGGTSPGTYNIDYVDGLFSSLGYLFANNVASQGEMIVMAQAQAPGGPGGEVKIPADVIPIAQRPPLEMVVSIKPLQGSCGEESLIASSAGSVMERFNDAEDDTCGLDFTQDEFSDEATDEAGKARKKKDKCRTDKSGQSSKEKTEKL